MAGTGRVITSGALIMIAVFLAFVASPVPSLKMLGLGLATAVLVDATLVRMVLVPATMALLGKANWWLPGWLDRILPRLTVEGSGEHGEAQAAVLDAAYDDAVPVVPEPEQARQSLTRLHRPLAFGNMPEASGPVTSAPLLSFSGCERPCRPALPHPLPPTCRAGRAPARRASGRRGRARRVSPAARWPRNSRVAAA